nr:hypothetical protein [Tanacetum cinerariifolium]
ALPEYADADIEGDLHEAIRYVEAPAESEFGVRWYFNNTFTTKHDLLFSVYVDGDLIGSRVFPKGKIQNVTKESPEGLSYLEKKVR